MPDTFWSLESLGSGVLLGRRDDGAVDGLSRRSDGLLRVEAPRWVPGGFSEPLGLEMGTTRLMSRFSELVRVRTGLDVLVAGLAPAGRVLVVGGFLVDGLGDSTFSLVGEAALAAV